MLGADQAGVLDAEKKNELKQYDLKQMKLQINSLLGGAAYG